MFSYFSLSVLSTFSMPFVLFYSNLTLFLLWSIRCATNLIICIHCAMCVTGMSLCSHIHTHTVAKANRVRFLHSKYSITPRAVAGYGLRLRVLLLLFIASPGERERERGKYVVSGPLAGTVDTWAQAVVFNMRLNILFISLRFEFYFLFCDATKKREKRKRAAKNWKSPAPTTSSVKAHCIWQGRSVGDEGVGEGEGRGA